jgi:MraZ protein
VVAKPRFINKFVNKIDRKGRVSVPATFRGALSGQSFLGIICYPSFKYDCVEGISRDRLDEMAERVDQLPEFSPERESIEGIFSRMHELPFDGEGRVMLPDALLQHAKITDQAAFVGRGNSFQIWEPSRFDARDSELIERARKQNATVPSPRAVDG